MSNRQEIYNTVILFEDDDGNYTTYRSYTDLVEYEHHIIKFVEQYKLNEMSEEELEKWFDNSDNDYIWQNWLDDRDMRCQEISACEPK